MHATRFRAATSQETAIMRGPFQLAGWSGLGVATGNDRLHRWAFIIALAAPLAGIVILAATAIAPALAAGAPVETGAAHVMRMAAPALDAANGASDALGIRRMRQD